MEDRTFWRYSSLIKWQATLMCFVRSWNTGFSVIQIALVLSACRGVGDFCVKPSSVGRPRSHRISEHASDMARYSASVDDLEIVLLFYFPGNKSVPWIHAPSCCETTCIRATCPIRIRIGSRCHWRANRKK